MNSADGEEGYPGNLTLTVTYGWSEDNELSILYEASTDADTLFNVTNHGYFNLNGEGHGDIMSHELFIDADEITELDDSQAPTGKFIPVDGTPFDFRTMHTIGKMYNSDYEQLKNSALTITTLSSMEPVSGRSLFSSQKRRESA